MGTHRTVASFLVLRPSPSHAVSWVESRRVDTRRAVFPSSQPRRAIDEAPEEVGATSSTSGRTETTRPPGIAAPSRAEEGASQPRSELTHPELAPADSRAEVNHAGPPVEPPQGPNAQRAVWGPDDPRNIRTLPPLPGPAETTPGARPGVGVVALDQHDHFPHRDPPHEMDRSSTGLAGLGAVGHGDGAHRGGHDGDAGLAGCQRLAGAPVGALGCHRRAGRSLAGRHAQPSGLGECTVRRRRAGARVATGEQALARPLHSTAAFSTPLTFVSADASSPPQ